MLGKKISWFVKDVNGEPVSVHESDGTGAINLDLVCDGIEFPNAIAMEIYKDGKIAERQTAALIKKIAQEAATSQAEIKRNAFGGGKNNDVDGTDVSGWWF
jgi:hypothetical protein